MMLIQFATEQKLVILADEVYQANVYMEVREVLFERVGRVRRVEKLFDSEKKR